MSSEQTREEEIVEVAGVKYIAKRQPSRLWPCQYCDLADQCTHENISAGVIPRCRRNERRDGANVVYFRYNPRYVRKARTQE